MDEIVVYQWLGRSSVCPSSCQHFQTTPLANWNWTQISFGDSLGCLGEWKVRKAKIRNWYNQVQHLTQDIIWESDKNTRKHHIQESQEVSPFPTAAGIRAKTNTNNKEDSLKKYCLWTVSKKIFVGLKLVSWHQPWKFVQLILVTWPKRLPFSHMVKTL